MPTEADTCRKFVVPKLQAAGWDNDLHSIAEQRWFTSGRIIVRGNHAERRKGKRADYLLRYTRDFNIAVVEAKPEYKKAADGLQQAKDYAEILSLKFAYATNGEEIIEFDFISGLERQITEFPKPEELWARLRTAENLTDDTVAQRLLTPVNLTTDKEPRYYQQIAINRAVQATLQGKRRVLLTMATGTGKTVVAFHMRKDKGLNRDLDCLPAFGVASVVPPFQGGKDCTGIFSWAFSPGFNIKGLQPAYPKGLKARNVIAWAEASPTSAGPGQPPPKISQAL